MCAGTPDQHASPDAGPHVGVVDAHAHRLNLAGGDYPWMSADLAATIRAALRAPPPWTRVADIGAVVLVQASPDIEETRWLLARAAEDPLVLGVVGKVDLDGAHALAQLRALARDPRLLGIRPMLRDMRAVNWLELPGLDAVLAEITALDLTFECMIRPPQAEALLRLLGRHPRLKAVLSHGGMPDIAAGAYGPWAIAIRRLATETSASCKLSGLTGQAGPAWSIAQLEPYVDHLIECFGAGRLLWGSDWPVCAATASYEQWLAASGALLAEIDASGRNAIFGANARAFYARAGRERGARGYESERSPG